VDEDYFARPVEERAQNRHTGTKRGRGTKKERFLAFFVGTDIPLTEVVNDIEAGTLQLLPDKSLLDLLPVLIPGERIPKPLLERFVHLSGEP
jgi:hypothetical protein